MRIDSRLIRAALDPGLILQSVYETLAWPFLYMKRSRHHRERTGHRFSPRSRPALPVDAATTAAVHARPGDHVVFVGVGLGEFMMMHRVAQALRRMRPDVKIGYALRDRNSLEFVREREPETNVSWWPDEAYFPVLRWLASQRPDVLVMTEDYRRPYIVVAAARFGARVALINGRCRYRKSFDRFGQGLFYRWLFGAYSVLAMQDDAYAANARRIAPPRCDVRATGDLKTDYSVLELAPEQFRGLMDWLGTDLPIVGAGSTDSLEEERMVIEAFLRTRAVVPCRLLLAPRQPKEHGALPDALREAGLSVSRRTEGAGGADVLLLDTQGELATAYRACAAAYVGGSYARKGGGHNPLEPLAWRVPVAYGRTRGHFETIQSLLESRGVATRIGNAQELADCWLRFLSDPAERSRIGDQGYEILNEGRGSVVLTAGMIAALLTP